MISVSIRGDFCPENARVLLVVLSVHKKDVMNTQLEVIVRPNVWAHCD
jgi:hypothetical protein